LIRLNKSLVSRIGLRRPEPVIERVRCGRWLPALTESEAA
jgi:hypothetical protein